MSTVAVQQIASVQSFDHFQRALGVVVLLMTAATLPIDAVTGFLLGSGAGFVAVSVLYKAALLSVMIIYLLAYKATELLLPIGALLLLLMAVWLRLLTTGDSSGIDLDIVNIVKVVTPFLAFGAARTILQSRVIDGRRLLFRVFLFSSLVMIGNLLAGILGFGFSTYSYSEGLTVGVKGFFYAGNEVSAVFLLLSGFMLMSVRRTGWLRYFAVATLLVVLGASIGTKSALGGILLLVLIMPLGKYGLRHSMLFAIGILLAGAMIGLVLYSLIAETPNATRIVTIFRSQGLIGVVLSSRDVFIADAWQFLYAGGDVLWPIWGLGHAGLDFAAGKGSIEIDPFDLFFYYGVCGLIVFSLLVALLLRPAGCRDATAQGGLVTNGLMLALSLTSGHVLTSGMLGIHLGMLTAYAIANCDRARAASGESAVTADKNASAGPAE